jgi:hypothetical protein
VARDIVAALVTNRNKIIPFGFVPFWTAAELQHAPVLVE